MGIYHVNSNATRVKPSSPMIVNRVYTMRLFYSPSASLLGLTLTFLATPLWADTVSPTAPLRDHAAAHGAFYGCAVPYGANDTPFYEAVALECGMLTPENATKMDTTRPTATTWNWSQADDLYNKAVAAHMPYRFHNFVWHNALPGWVNSTVNAGNARQFMANHIYQSMQHFKGKNVHSWDVVNEAVETNDGGRTDGLRNSIWMKLIGEDYLDFAFRTAAQYNTVPGSLLVYNDYGIEENNSWAEARRQTTLRMLKGLVARGVPIDALGVQAHLYAPSAANEFAPFRIFLGEVTKLGLKVIISELDVSEHNLAPRDVPTRDAAIANTYRAFLDVALSNPNVIGVQTWGLEDKYSWMQVPAFTWGYRADGLQSRSLVLGDLAGQRLQRKPSWFAIRDAFTNRPSNALNTCDTSLGFSNTAPYLITGKQSALKLDTGSGAALVQGLQTGTTPTWKIDPIDNGFVTLTLNRNSLSMDATVGAGEHEAVKGAGYNYDTKQQWCIQAGSSNGFYKISNRRTGQALSVADSSTAQSAAIVQTADSSTDNAQWQISGGLIKQTLFDFESSATEDWQASSANPNLKTARAFASHGVQSLAASLPIGGGATPSLFVDGNWDLSAYSMLRASLGQGKNRLYNGLSARLFVEVGIGHTRYYGPQITIPFNDKVSASLSLAGLNNLSDVRRIGVEYSSKPYAVKKGTVYLDRLAIE